MKQIDDNKQDLLPEYNFDYTKAKSNRFAIDQAPIKIEIAKNLLDYYFKFKELAILHKQFEFGKNPPLPEVFTQNICRELYGLEKWENRKADAKNSSGEAIEIKATSSKSGTTTIDIKAIKELGDSFSGLYWLYFDIDNDDVEIRFIDKNKLKTIRPKKGHNRNNITLSKLAQSSSRECYHFERTGLIKR